MSSIFFFFMIPFSTGTELLDILPSDVFWQARKVSVNGERMMAELEIQKVEDVSSLIAEMGSDDFRTRKNATRKIRALGPGVFPQLEKASKAKDAELSKRAKLLLKEFGEWKRDHYSRRLMAIRTLGELKHKPAVKLLKSLASSRQLFEREHAKRALSRIEGKPFAKSRLTRKEFDEDLWLLPKKCSFVAQLGAGEPIPLQLERFFKSLESLQGLSGNIKPAEMKKQFYDQVLKVISETGNARIDALTVGVSDDLGPNAGFAVVIARGLYDRNHLLEYLKKHKFQEEKTKGGHTAVKLENTVKLILVSETRLIILAGADNKILPMDEIDVALKTGKGELDRNKQMVSLIESVNRDSYLWMVSRLNGIQQLLPTFKIFKTATLTLVHKNAKADLTMKVIGNDEEAIRKMVEKAENSLKEIIENIEPLTKQMPLAKTARDFLKTIEFQQDKMNLTITARMDDPASLLFTPLIFLIVGGPF